jgi:hypothetical protein
MSIIVDAQGERLVMPGLSGLNIILPVHIPTSTPSSPTDMTSKAADVHGAEPMWSDHLSAKCRMHEHTVLAFARG